ncbi:MAG: endonuclease/exonuclease/phosphatase family protein [Patescibacteria group bacterium]|nr:endonuclease/exonuclease/phosphatase family protein [Patescibacteria group bacterium]
MLIFSWNCCLSPWSINRRKRLPKIISAIVAISPDIVCLQEVFFKSDADSVMYELKAYGFLDSFYFKDLLIISKIKLSEKRGWIFRKQGNIFSLAMLDVLYGKAFQAVQFLNKDEHLSLINAHLLSAYANDSRKYQDVREDQSREIREVSEKLLGDKKIIAGDFNFQPATSPYKVLTESNFVDTTTKENTTATRHLDFIFLKNFPKGNARIATFDNSLSDHAALGYFTLRICRQSQ